jgi:hypothetical protein
MTELLAVLIVAAPFAAFALLRRRPRAAPPATLDEAFDRYAGSGGFDA